MSASAKSKSLSIQLIWTLASFLALSCFGFRAHGETADSIYAIVAAEGELSLNVYGASEENGAKVASWPWSGGADNELWLMKKTAPNKFLIISKLSNKALTVQDGKLTINSSSPDLAPKQTFIAQQFKKGVYSITLAESGLALTRKDQDIVFLENKRSPAQQWKIVERAKDGSGPPPIGNWEMIWSDEFNGTKLNSKNWTRCKRNNADWGNTLSDRSDLLNIKNGILELRGIVNPDTSKDKSPYLTAAVESRNTFSFQYGKVEIRARFKSAQGAWPALWMLGKNGGWPANGEMDLMEHLNFDKVVYQTVHSEYTVNIDKSNTPRKGGTAQVNPDDWNLYGCEWDKDKIVFTVNGKSTHTYPRVPEKGEKQWPFDQPFYFVLSMQIGGGWVNGSGATNPNHYPADLSVDYVRVYQNKE